jgi:ABC-2 type transport system permease protein
MSITGLLIRREFVERVRQRSFVWATAIGVVGIIALALLPHFISGFIISAETKIAIVAPDAATAAAASEALTRSGNIVHVVSMRVKGPDLPASLRKDLNDGTYDAALVAYRDSSRHLGFAYYPKTSSALQSASDVHDSLQRAVLVADVSASQRSAVEQALHFQFNVHSLNARYKSGSDQFFSVGIVYFLLIILYIAVIAYGMMVAQGVIEEKANRIMEVMIGAVRPSQLLAGKIFGISAVALLQLTLNALAAAVAAIIAGVLYGTSSQGKAAASAASASPETQAMVQRIMSEGLPHVPWVTLGFLLVFFFLGFFSYAAVYAGIGSLLSKPEEVQQYSTVFMLPIIAAYVLAIFALQFPDLPIVVWGSMIPLVSPMLMFTRISTTDVPAWQIAVSIGGSLVAIWGLTILAGKLYRVGVLMYGKPPRPIEIWRALRAHT